MSKKPFYSSKEKEIANERRRERTAEARFLQDELKRVQASKSKASRIFTGLAGRKARPVTLATVKLGPEQEAK